MTKKTFNRGDTVYDLHGNAGCYVSEVGAGHAVEPIYEDDETGEPYFATIQTWRDVFKTPPTQVLHEECAALQKSIADANAQLDLLRLQRDDFVREERARADRVKRHKQLELLDDFLAGRITHFVVRRSYSNEVRIQEAKDALAGRDEWRREWTKLLTLYGDAKGDLQWRLNHYADGSGSSGDWLVWPCVSHKHALKVAAEVIDGLYAEARARHPDRMYAVADTVKSAQELGIPVPEDITTALAASYRETAIKQIPDLEKRLAEAQANLDKARATAAA